jgi:transposase
VIKHGSYREYQGYLCKDCNQTLNHNTGTIFEHSTIPLRMWYLAIYMYIRQNTSIQQLDAEPAVSHKTVYRRVRCFPRALDTS